MTEMGHESARVGVEQIERVPGWEKFPWLWHGFSTRIGGASTVYGGSDLNLGFTSEDSPLAVRENRRRVAGAVTGSQDIAVVAVRQVHGTAVKLVGKGGGTSDREWTDGEGRAVVEADGLMTLTAGMLLGVQAADCVPVLVADPVLRVVAAFHAGWRGTHLGIVEEGVAAMRDRFGSLPGNLIAAVGPSIRSCCYTVGEEVRSSFYERFTYAAELFRLGDDGLHLDLAEANRRQLLAAGVEAEGITVLPECTACTRLGDGSRKYFSHRAEAGFTGRAMGVIGIADGLF